MHWAYPEFSYTQLENNSDRQVEKEERNPSMWQTQSDTSTLHTCNKHAVESERKGCGWEFQQDLDETQIGLHGSASTGAVAPETKRSSEKVACNSQSPSLLSDLFPIIPSFFFPYNFWHSFKHLINTFFLFLPCHSVYLEWLNSKFESTKLNSEV